MADKTYGFLDDSAIDDPKAQDAWLTKNQDWGSWNAPDPEQSYGDFAFDTLKGVAASSLDIAGQAASAGQAAAANTNNDSAANRWSAAGYIAHSVADRLRDSKSEAGKRGADAKLLPGEGEDSVFKHPLTSAGAIFENFMPYIGLFSLVPESLPALAATGSSVQVMADIDQAMRLTQGMDDAELRKKLPAYARYRDDGMSEVAARGQINRDTYTAGQLALSGGVGALTGIPAGHVLKGVAGGSGRMLSRAAIGAGEGLAGMGVGSAESDISGQLSGIAVGTQKEIDPAQTGRAMLEGAGTGAFIGAVGGAIHSPKRGSKVERTTESGPDAAQRAALDAHATEGAPDAGNTPPPPPPAPAGAAPVTPQGNAPVPPDVAAAAQRVRTGAEPSPAAPATPEGNAPVPPDVAAAAQRVRAPAEPTAGMVTPDVATPDTGMNAPEAPATLDAQRRKLIDGEVSAVMYPAGTPVPEAPPPGMKRHPTKRGTFDYDPSKLTPKQITAATRAGRENDILGLGPLSKADVVAEAAKTGEQPVAVVERAPDGTEVKGSLATPSTVDVQAPTIEAAKTPGNTVGIEAPDQVVAGRVKAPTPDATPAPAMSIAMAPTPGGKVAAVKARARDAATPAPASTEPRAPRILPDISEIGRAAAEEARSASAALADQVKRENKALEQRERRDQGETVALEKKSKVEKAKRVSDANTAKQIFDDNTSTDVAIPRDAKGRDALHARLRRVSDAAAAAGVRVPEKVGYDSTADHIVWLREARNLLKRLDEGKASAEHIQDFLLREAAARGGDFTLMRSERKAAGETMSRGAQADVERVGDRTAPADFVDRGPENTSVAATSRAPARISDGTEKAAVKRADGGTETIDRAKGGEVRSVAITPEMRAKYNTGSSAKDAPRPEPRAKPKSVAEASTSRERGAAIKEKAKAERTTTSIQDRHGNVLANRGYDPRPDIEKTRADHDEAQRDASRGEIEGAIGNVRPLETVTGADALRQIPADHLTGVAGKLIPFIKKRLLEVVGGVKIHFVASREEMYLLSGDRRVLDAGGYYDPDRGHIVIYRDQTAAALHHTIMHELVHAATQRAIDGNEALRSLVDKVAEEVSRAVGDDVTRNVAYSGERAPLWQHYGFTNAHEFISEALTNTEFQKKIADVPLSSDLAKELGLDPWRKHSVWSGVVALVRRFVLHLPADTYTALEGVMATAERAFDAGRVTRAAEGDHILMNRSADRGPELDRMFRSSFSDALGRGVNGVRSAAATLAGNPIDNTAAAIRGIATRPGAGDTLRRIGRYMTTNDQYRQNVEHLFPGAHDENLVRRIFDGVEKQGVLAGHLREQGDDIVRAMARAQKAAPEAFRRFADLMNDATMLGVDPAAGIGAGRNAHLTLSKENAAKAAKGTLAPHDLPMDQWEAHKAQPDLARRYEALVDQNPEFTTLMDSSFSYFHDAQQDMARGHIENILRAVDATGDIRARVEEIRDARPSEEWREKIEKEFGEPALAEFLKAKQLAGDAGPYVPLMRHGDWAVVGRYAVQEPTNAVAHNGDTWEFKSRKEAHDFAAASGLNFTAGTAYYDRTTGKHTTKGDITVAGDPEQRFSVTLQRDHVEFHDTHDAADAARRELGASGAMEKVSEALDRRQHTGLASELTSAGMQAILKRLEQTAHYKAASPTERAEMRKALSEASMSMKAGNRVQSRRLPRRRVGGASDDLVRNMHEYNSSQANYLAKLEYRPQVDAAIKEMRDFERSNEYGKGATERSVAANEIERRARAADPSEYSGALTDLSRRLGTLSYIDRMMRPSHLILHQTHLPMITVPIIAGRHGVMRAYGMMMKVWSMATRAYAAGGRDFVASIADNLHKGVDYTRLMKESFAKELDGARIARMFDKLAEIGLIHPQGSLDGAEIMRNSPSRTSGAAMRTFDGVLGKLDTTFRHLTNATEAINRYVGATTAYRLEFERLTREGKGEAAAHDLAVDYARHILANSEGFFSSTNAAPLFKNKWLKPFLQFRQFPQMMYHLLGRTAVQALKGATRAEKIEALKSLGLILASHSAMTGVLGGLPLDAAIVTTTVAKGLGITDTDWADVEREQNALAVRIFGKEGAELVMHGLGAQLGLDVRHRLGLNHMFTFGLPDELSKESVWGFIGQTAMGAPGGLVADAFTGINKMASGDLIGGAAKAFPLQALRDVRAAWAGGSGGYEYSPAERATKLAGFTPAAEAAHYEAQRDLKSQRDDFEKKRRRLMSDWIEAEPTGKADAWKAIQRFNATKPKDAQITMKGLKAAVTRKPADEIDGVRFGRRTKFIADEFRETH